MAEISIDRLVPTPKKSGSGIQISPDRLIPLDGEQTELDWKSLYQKSKPYLKPIGEGLAMGVGAIVGSPGGPVGVVAGGALGYATVDQTFDYLDTVFGVRKPGTVKEEVIGGAQSLKEGAEYAVAGELGGAAIGGVVKGAKAIGKKMLPAFREKTIQRRVGKELIEQGTELTSEQIQKNINQAKKLEKTIPGLRFTRGQITNDAQAIALERSLIRSGLKVRRGKFDVSSADLNQEQRAFAEKALQDYYESQLYRGNLDDFTKVLAKDKTAFEVAAKESEDIVNSEVQRLSRSMDEQEVGSVMLQSIKSKKGTAKLEAEDLYNKIPNESLQTDELQDALKEIVRSEDKIIEPKTLKMLGLVRRITTKKMDVDGETVIVAKDTGYQALRRLRSRIGKNIRAATAGPNPDVEDARQLKLLQEAVEDAMDKIVEISPEAKTAYEKATQYYKKDYIPKFRQGTVADVLARGSRGEETKIAMANIAKKFFTKDGADDFLRAVGDDKLANSVMEEYAHFDLFNKAYNSYKGSLDLNKASGWLQKNGRVLDKFGLKEGWKWGYHGFKNIIKKGEQLEVNQAALDVFNKSVASDILKASPKEFVGQAFKGSKNYGQTARELILMAKGDKAAINGIRKAMSEHILESSKVTAEGFFTEKKVSVAKLTNKLKEYMPALEQLYKGDAKKLKAIKDVHKSYQISNRSTGSPLGGGSDTAENISHIMAAASGARAGRYYLIISIKKAITKYSDNQMNRYLLKAMFDPDYASSVMSLANANKLKKIDTSKEINRFHQLMKLIPYAIKKDIQGVDQ